MDWKPNARTVPGSRVQPELSGEEGKNKYTTCFHVNLTVITDGFYTQGVQTLKISSYQSEITIWLSSVAKAVFPISSSTHNNSQVCFFLLYYPVCNSTMTIQEIFIFLNKTVQIFMIWIDLKSNKISALGRGLCLSGMM